MKNIHRARIALHQFFAKAAQINEVGRPPRPIVIPTSEEWLLEDLHQILGIKKQFTPLHYAFMIIVILNFAITIMLVAWMMSGA